MSSRIYGINKKFLLWTVILTVLGFFIFTSASLGLLAKDEVKFSNVAFKQIFFGLFLGSIACLISSRIDYRFWKKYSFILLLISVLLTLLVFVPNLGIEHGGAKRWVDLKFISFQPAEILKIAFIAYFAAWLTKIKKNIETVRWGLMPFLFFLGLLGTILLLQPDTDTFAVIVFASLSMYLVSGGKWKHMFVVFLLGIIIIGALAFTRPYIMQRIKSMIDPTSNKQTTSYQLNQSLIAIGSGGLSGKGFGQSIQKFNYLPEPIGDSVFAVAAEEFGFIGTFIIISIFTVFAIEGLKISSESSDDFGKLFSLGIVILIISQTMINIGGMTGILPLTGITLPFVSHGGTSLFINLVEAGIIMNISRNRSIKK